MIHAAGVTYGGPFKMTNEVDSKLLFDIKYWGTRYLYDATKARKLRFFWMASSISAAVGDFNISHYAAANSSMDWSFPRAASDPRPRRSRPRRRRFAEEMRKDTVDKETGKTIKGDKNIVSTQWGALATEGGMARARRRPRAA